MGTYLIHYGVKGMKWGQRKKSQYTLDSMYETSSQYHNGQRMRKSSAGRERIRQNMGLGRAAARGQITKKNGWKAATSETGRRNRYNRAHSAATRARRKHANTRVSQIRSLRKNGAGYNALWFESKKSKKYQPNQAKKTGVKKF